MKGHVWTMIETLNAKTGWRWMTHTSGDTYTAYVGRFTFVLTPPTTHYPAWSTAVASVFLGAQADPLIAEQDIAGDTLEEVLAAVIPLWQMLAAEASPT